MPSRFSLPPNSPLACARRALLKAVASFGGAQLLCAPAWAQSSSAVRVTQERPVIRRVEFNPRRPPRDMPPLTPPEAGVCLTTFELSAGVTYSAERIARNRARVYVDELDIVTRLRFDIYTVKDAPPKLRAHEEGHRAIGEHFYASAPQIAEQIGRRLIGATFEGEGPTEAAAQKDGFQKVVANIESEYMARVRVPSAAANERFDEITNHGLDPIDEAEAVRLALDASSSP
jgi:hypothetical protein